ncbi:MAG: hypothetical protein RLY78_1392 [Pseudomonadota bacterium]
MPSARPVAAPAAAARPARLLLSVEALCLIVALFWLASANLGFLRAAMAASGGFGLATLPLAVGLCGVVFALHALLLLLLATRRTLKPLLWLLLPVAAATSWFAGQFGVLMDPGMVRNVLRTDTAEARELLSPALLVHLALFAGLPLLLLSRVELRARGWGRALRQRALALLAVVVVLIGALLAVFQPLSSLMRNHKGLRYQITPANAVWSTGSVLAQQLRGAARPREAIGLDARPGPSWATAPRPRVLVLVVGETARAANWGLNGYTRQTTPELAALPVINFGAVQSCGTHTEVSLPCMFAPVGRRDYDEDRIRGQQSLLHVLARAGVGVDWRDNQSGCKGVCEGLPATTVTAQDFPAACEGGRCLDEALFADLGQRLDAAQGTQIWVLHMLGNHGPSYFRRYPPGFETWQPACASDDLRQCSTAQITKAYDNALRYTDHLLAGAIRQLQSRAGRVDSALIYVSDHGESLGEMNLYLHGVPYAMAPREQRQVPMVFWRSSGFEQGAGLKPACLEPTLRRHAQIGDVRHDHLFHTVLGLLDVRTALHEPDWDLTRGCRDATATAGPAPGPAGLASAPAAGTGR